MQSTAHFRSAPLSVAAWFLAALFVAPVFPSAAAAQNVNNPQVVRLAKVEGAVEVQRPTEPTPEAAPINLPLEQGATLTTERGTASIEWDNGGTGFLADNSVLEFTQLAAAPNGRITRLTMREGAARFFANVGNGDTFAVLTPDVTVTAQPGGDFRVDVYRDGTTVTVLNGQALVGSAGASWTVQKGQTLSMPSGELQPTIALSPPLDQFDQGSSAGILKQMQDIAAERGYLPPALTGGNTTYGMAELHNYGTWTPLPNYGYGWQPLGVGADWLPFQNGIWILSPATGQTGPFWVSGEPWGWLPYHFGRWLYSPQGWFWIPSTLNAFNPAPVDFVHVGNRAGWVAASPLDQPNKPPANASRGVLVRPAANGKTQIASATATPGGAVRIAATGGLQTMGNPPINITRQLATPLTPAKPITALAGGATLPASGPARGPASGSGGRSTGILGGNSRARGYENGYEQPRLRDGVAPPWATKPVIPVNQRSMPPVPAQANTTPVQSRSAISRSMNPAQQQAPPRIPDAATLRQYEQQRQAAPNGQPPGAPNPGANPGLRPQLPRPYVAPVQPVQQPIQQQAQPRPAQPAPGAPSSAGVVQPGQPGQQPGAPQGGSAQEREQQRRTQQGQ